MSSVKGSSRRGRALGRWEDRVKEYMSERGNDLEQAKRECMDRERWRSFCRSHPLEDALGGREASERQWCTHHTTCLVYN